MLKGINLTLMIGPLIAIPVPKEVLDSLTSIVVTNKSKGPSGFQLQFSLSNRSPLHTLFLLSGGVDIPLVRVIIVVTMNGTAEVLIDGVMTNHQITPGTDSAHPTLTVTGEDLTRVMDYIDFSGFPFPAMPAEARVLIIMAKYAMFGFIPLVIPSVLIDLPIPTRRIPKQKGTDLAYVKGLAEKVGYTFYVEAGPLPGANLAYWGPEIKVGVPQPALNINMDAHTNVESMSFTFNSDKKVVPVIAIQEELTKAPIPIRIPDITPLSPPLGLIPGFAKHYLPITGTGKYTFPQALLIGLAKAAKSSDSVTGTGSLNVMRYGRILKARRLVGVRGVGTAYDGLHYVTSVTHNIRRGEYKSTFTLSRNGLISTVGTVPV